MKRLLLCVLMSVVALLLVPTTVVAGTPPDNAVTVTVSGNGTWESNHLSVSVFPGESKVFAVSVHNNLDQELHVKVIADPGCVPGGDVTACLCPDEADLFADTSYSFNLTVSASGVASTDPGVFAFNLSVETDTDFTEPEPEPKLPDHMTLSMVHETRVEGNANEVIATVFDDEDSPLPDIAMQWSVLSGNATLANAGTVTNANGRVTADVLSGVAGTADVRCRVSSNTSISKTVTLTWTASPSDGNGGNETDGGGNGGGDTTPKKGLPAWLVFIIGVGIIGGAFGGYFYYKRWQARKSIFHDPFADLDGLDGGEGKGEDELDLD